MKWIKGVEVKIVPPVKIHGDPNCETCKGEGWHRDPLGEAIYCRCVAAVPANPPTERRTMKPIDETWEARGYEVHVDGIGPNAPRGHFAPESRAQLAAQAPAMARLLLAIHRADESGEFTEGGNGAARLAGRNDPPGCWCDSMTPERLAEIATFYPYSESSSSGSVIPLYSRSSRFCSASCSFSRCRRSASSFS